VDFQCHSGGLESAMYHGFIGLHSDKFSLKLYVKLLLEQAAHQMIPLVSDVHYIFSFANSLSLSSQVKQLGVVDSTCQSVHMNQVSR
jgi:hypothetical protein